MEQTNWMEGKTVSENTATVSGFKFCCNLDHMNTIYVYRAAKVILQWNFGFSFATNYIIYLYI